MTKLLKNVMVDRCFGTQCMYRRFNSCGDNFTLYSPRDASSSGRFFADRTAVGIQQAGYMD